MRSSPQGLLIVISGSSGVGKGTICRELRKRFPDIEYSVSATTRKPRAGEVNASDYYFYTKEDFEKLIENDELLEWARVYDNYYGTPRKYVEELIASGKDCILEIDVQGALQVKKKKPEAVLIFILPPSKDELIRRITCRGTEEAEEIKKRMKQVDEELAHLPDYHYVVVNEELEEAVYKIQAIITAERCRSDRVCYFNRR